MLYKKRFQFPVDRFRHIFLKSESEWLLLSLVALNAPNENEPRLLTRERAHIQVARQTYDHFKKLNLPPIFGSFEYEALKLQGVK
jgi:hypothetical protein